MNCYSVSLVTRTEHSRGSAPKTCGTGNLDRVKPIRQLQPQLYILHPRNKRIRRNTKDYRISSF